MLSGACFSMFFHAKGIDLGLQQACSCGAIAYARTGWAMPPVVRKHCFSPSRLSPAHPGVAVFFPAAYRFFPELAVFMVCLRDKKCEKNGRFFVCRRCGVQPVPLSFTRPCAGGGVVLLRGESGLSGHLPLGGLPQAPLWRSRAFRDAAFHYLSVWVLSTRCGMSPCPTRSMGQPKCSSSSSMGSSVSG